MRRTTLMLPDSLWAAVQEESKRQGVSASQFIREASLAAVYFERGRRTTRPGELLDQAREELRGERQKPPNRPKGG